MSKEEAIRRIIMKYCEEKHISTSEFARKSKISKAYISNIVNNKLGKYGISSTIQSLLSKGLDINDEVEFEKIIKQYQNNNHIQNSLEKETLISKISSSLYRLEESDLEIVFAIIENSNSEKLSLIDDYLKNME